MLLNYLMLLIWNNKDDIVPYKNLCIFQLQQKKQKGNLKMQIRVAWKITKYELLARKSAYVVTYA